jgi:uncharacterized membrane protein
MEAHASSGRYAHRPRSADTRSIGGALLGAGAISGVAAGIVMALWQMVVGAIVQEPTAAPGIDSSFWTTVTSIPSVPFGMQWFHGSFEFWAVALGLIVHLLNSAILGVVGLTLVTSLLGRRPNAIAAIALGLAFGLVLEAVVVNLVVNQIQDVNTVYTSTPGWSWWLAHGLFGATLGLVGSTLLRRQPA